MKHLDEYRDAQLCRQLSNRIARAAGDRPVVLMEVCGTHTMAVYQYGLKDLLPPNVTLLSGPGCPVCVTPNSYLDRAIACVRRDDVILATFGDMLRVPGSSSSLVRERARGGDVRLVYSPADALVLARRHPHKMVVFLGIGFETTSPSVAAAVADAHSEGLQNFLVLVGHKVLPPALKALVDDPQLQLQGLICPGHVSAITGKSIYEFLARDHGIACVITGFEPSDILQSILMLVTQITKGQSRVENQYRRVVPDEGNPRARELVAEVFRPLESEWRGLGHIPESGLVMNDRFRDHDAESHLPVEVEQAAEHPGCICGLILRGRKTPLDCALFAASCTPDHPVGACMVSSEGTCAAQFRYARFQNDPEGRSR
jgi:hydrogenase expression/formation protein HypD